MITPESLARSGTEHGEQMAVFCWAAQNLQRYPLLRWMFAIPNGGGRSMRQGAMLKAEGVKPGVSDIMLPVPKWRLYDHAYHYEYMGLFIELKRRDGKPSDVREDQKQFLQFVTDQRYCAEVAFGWEQAVAIIEKYLEWQRHEIDSVPGA